MEEQTSSRFPVVVGVDFSEASAYAVQEAVQLARHVPSIELNFVHVVAAPPDLHDAKVIEALSERLGRTMAKFENFVRDVMFVFGAPHDGAYRKRVRVRVKETERRATVTLCRADGHECEKAMMRVVTLHKLQRAGVRLMFLRRGDVAVRRLFTGRAEDLAVRMRDDDRSGHTAD